MEDRNAEIVAALHARSSLPGEVVEALEVAQSFQELEDPCPSCGQTKVVCCYGDTGTSEMYRDEFVHVCTQPGCNYVRHHEHVSSVGQGVAQDQLCPFCGRDAIGFSESGRRAMTGKPGPSTGH